MVIRWNHVATLVVVTLTAVIHCKQINSSQIQLDTRNRKAEDLCPCLPVDICPRVFGTKPEDAKYLGNIRQCDGDNLVRCCGASASFVVGKNNATEEAAKVEITTTKIPHQDILPTLNADDIHDNEIPNAESETSTLSGSDEDVAVRSAKDEENIANFHAKQRLNGEFDEETAESKSVPKTLDTEIEYENKSLNGNDSATVDVTSDTTIMPSVIVQRSHRQPKNLDDVITVYPNIMSGIPKTTPRNMPETNEMTMFDKETGMDVHLVFSKTTIKPELPVQEEPTSTVSSTEKKPLYQFAKRRRQYRPIQKVTTETPDDVELEPTTKRSRIVSRQRNRVRNFNSTTPEPTNSATKLRRSKTSTKAPVTQDEEILHTSEDDKSHQNRFRLFNARHRLNYLQRNITTTTTESPIEITTSLPSKSNNLVKKRPLRVEENASQIRVRSRPSKMNETLIRVMDTNHQNMLMKVRVALSTENQITEIPRSFSSVEMNNRVMKIEEMLANKMVNVYTDTKTKLRGNRQKDTSEINNTERQISEPTSDSTRPFRGNKKFQLMDLFDKTPVVPMVPINEVRRMRGRSTTPRPIEIVEDVVVTTTRRPRQRITTTIQPSKIYENKTNIRDSRIPENKEGRNYRRRVIMRRRYTTELPFTTSTTNSPTVPSTSESTKPLVDSTISTTTIPTTVLATAAPEITTALIESNVDSQDASVDEVQDESTKTIDIAKETTTINPTLSANSDALSDFKPSPLWSISSDEKTDFQEQNHSYDMTATGNEQTPRKINRQSRSSFDPPAEYLNGFVPVTLFTSPVQIIGPIPKSSKLGDDAKLRYNLPRDTKAHFSKN